MKWRHIGEKKRMEQLKQVYDMLEDEVSKDIYIHKVNYLVTGKSFYLDHIIDICVSDLKCAESSLAQDIEDRFSGLESNHTDAVIVIGTGNYFEEIKAELCREGVSCERILNLGNYVPMSSARQYFEEPFLAYSTWDEEAMLNFSQMGNACSDICENGSTVIRTMPIDRVVREKVTFIKMDVEGAELKSLMGAHDTILRDRPKLAVSIYHKYEDMIQIPLYIKSLVPEYRLYVRHYSNNACETVLYAI